MNKIITERWEFSIQEPLQIIESSQIVECRVFRNDFQIYFFAAVSMSTALVLAEDKVRRLATLPVRINSRADVNERVLERPVFYREFPAIIADFDGEKGRVMLRSDFQLPRINSGFPTEPWNDEEEPECSQDVWEDLLSPKIHWHRDEAA